MESSPASSRALGVVERLRATYPEATTSLDHRNAFELLVATVLSAQTTDARVNTVTPTLFSRWQTPEDLATADPASVEQVVRPLGFQHRRATQVVGLAHALVEHFGGAVPAASRDLESLPGVGRKTANVVLGNAFGVPGITVDTHVGRLARRLGWTRNTDPVKVEADIADLLPPEEWTMACHRLIFHGRRVCTARRPACETCGIVDLCPRIGVGAPSRAARSGTALRGSAR